MTSDKEKNLPSNANLYNSINNIRSNNEQVISNKQQLIYRFASDDKSSNDKRSTSEANKSSGKPQKDYSFITKLYEDAAQNLVRENIFSASFSLLGEKTPDRRSMNIDIIQKPGDKPLKYKVDMVTSRYSYELLNSLSDKEKQWGELQNIRQNHAYLDQMWGKLRNRTSNTRIVPRKRLPFCWAGIDYTAGSLEATLICGKANHIKCELQAVQNKELAKLFVAKGTWINPEWDEGTYDVQL